MTRKLYEEGDLSRRVDLATGRFPDESYRTHFRRDFARVVHSPSFRRLAGKTQLFPCGEGDYFRNRLTHSLEVAQVAKSIAIKLRSEVPQLAELDTDLIELAAYCHDIGHPPFGHNGEEALDACMSEYGGFEGNAQTLRIVSRLEKRESSFVPNGGLPTPINPATNDDCRVGLNLTARSLASMLKYDAKIPTTSKVRGTNGIQKGYYSSDSSTIDFIRSKLNCPLPHLRTIECSIMDISDDIAYSTYDLEDALKSGLLRPTDMLAADERILLKVAKKVKERHMKAFGSEVSLDAKAVLLVLKKVFERVFDEYNSYKEDFDSDPLRHPIRSVPRTFRSLAENGYARNQFTSQMIGGYIRSISVSKPHDCDVPAFWNVTMKQEEYIKMEVIKNFVFESLIMSPTFQAAKYRGKKIVTDIYNALNDSGEQLLPEDARDQYRFFEDRPEERNRVLSDFISGMTDRYAIDFHRRLTGWDAPPVTQVF